MMFPVVVLPGFCYSARVAEFSLVLLIEASDW